MTELKDRLKLVLEKAQKRHQEQFGVHEERIRKLASGRLSDAESDVDSELINNAIQMELTYFDTLEIFNHWNKSLNRLFRLKQSIARIQQQQEISGVETFQFRFREHEFSYPSKTILSLIPQDLELLRSWKLCVASRYLKMVRFYNLAIVDIRGVPIPASHVLLSVVSWGDWCELKAWENIRAKQKDAVLELVLYRLTLQWDKSGVRLEEKVSGNWFAR